MIPHVQELTQTVPVTTACAALDVPRSRYYRSKPAGKGQPAETETKVAAPAEKAAHKRHPRALSAEEEATIHALLNSERFRDRSPYAVFGTLLDEEQRYLCSIRTMYRILQRHGETTPRGRQRARTAYQKPELLATAPNQVWSWDITKLRGPRKWTYYYLYVMLDIFSRYVVGWHIATRESAALGKELIAAACLGQGITKDQLTIHADRGGPMTAKGVAQLLADLGVTRTHTRPYTSNDNPYSEAQFKTVKYRPDYPDRFGSLQDARGWARPFFHWYNHEHRHTALSLMTPAMIHAGRGAAVLDQRRKTLATAYAAHPERFVRGRPQPGTLPEKVWINPPAATTDEDGE